MRKRITGKESPCLKKSETILLYKRAFSILNKDLFKDKLPNISISYPDAETENELKQETCSAVFIVWDDGTPEIYLGFDTTPGAGISTEDINNLFHEMTHYYCYVNGIEDSDKEYHNLNFKKAIEEHKGTCSFSDNINGYNKTSLSDDYLNAVLKEI